eukprot:3452468-Pleurochrysis_carterae.AAC.1
MLLLQHRAKLERDRLVCSTLPPHLPANHSSSEIARLPVPKFLLALPSGNRARVSMPAASVATVVSQARSLPQVSPSSGQTPPASGEQPVQISQAFVRSCDRFPSGLRAKFIAQEQD